MLTVKDEAEAPEKEKAHAAAAQPRAVAWVNGKASQGDEGPSCALLPLLLRGLQADGLSPVPG